MKNKKTARLVWILRKRSPKGLSKVQRPGQGQSRRNILRIIGSHVNGEAVEDAVDLLGKVFKMVTKFIVQYQ